MRTLVSILVFGITFLSYSQEKQDQSAVLELDDVVVSVNASYLSEVQDENTPKVARVLQHQAASFDVSKLRKFDPRSVDSFEMMFKNGQGKLSAFYDATGKIIEAYESFTNVSLPKSIRDRISKANENWQMIGNQYNSTYSDNNYIQRTFKIKLQNGNHSKDIVINL